MKTEPKALETCPHCGCPAAVEIKDGQIKHSYYDPTIKLLLEIHSLKNKLQTAGFRARREADAEIVRLREILESLGWTEEV